MAAQLSAVEGVQMAYPATYAREFAVTLPVAPSIVIDGMARRGFLAGIDLTLDYPDLGNALLIALTERRTKDDIDDYVEALEEVIANA